MKKEILVGLAISALAFAGAAHAAPITSDMDPALAGSILVDFEAGPAGTFGSQAFGGLTVSAPGTSVFSVAGDFAGSYNTRGRLHISNFGTDFQQLRFDFTAPVSAFGFLFGASDASWTIRAYDAADTLLDSTNIAPVFASNAGDFFGLAGLSGASYATVTQNYDGYYANGGTDYVFVDDFRYVNGGSSVPEPSTLALLGACCLAAALTRKSAKA